jgi:type III secretory pathway component EscV
MGTLRPFEAVLERNEFTEIEFLSLKNKLAELRREFAQKTGVHSPNIDLKNLQKIEQKMYSLEHILAHASIVQEPVEEPGYLSIVKSIFTEARLNLMGRRMALQQKIRPQKHGYTNHTSTYHIKR